MNGSGKHSSLLRYCNNYIRKKLCSRGPRLFFKELQKSLGTTTFRMTTLCRTTFSKLIFHSLFTVLLIEFIYCPVANFIKPFFRRNLRHYRHVSLSFNYGACIIKLISAIIYGFSIKLECLTLASLFSLA